MSVTLHQDASDVQDEQSAQAEQKVTAAPEPEKDETTSAEKGEARRSKVRVLHYSRSDLLI